MTRKSSKENTSKAKRVSYDSFFKSIIEEFPKESLETLLPELIKMFGEIISWESLRQEMDKALFGSKGAVADAVLRYKFENGEATLVLYEAQHDRYSFDVEKLMVYTFRLSKKYPGENIIPLVVFTDRKKNPIQIPTEIKVGVGQKYYLQFSYVAVKVNEIDPTAVSSKIGAFFRIIEPMTDVKDEDKVEVMVRCLLELHRNYPAAFTKYLPMIDKNTELNDEQSSLVNKILEKEDNMVSIFEPTKQKGIEIGRLEGIQIGKSEGIQIGKSEGVMEGMKRSLKESIRFKFKKLPADVSKKISGLDEKQLLKAQKRLFEIDSLDSLFDN